MAKAASHSGTNGREIHVRIPQPRLARPASIWVALTGMLCLAMAAVLFPRGLVSFLSPYAGKGPALHEFTVPLLVKTMRVLVFTVHCASVLALGLAGAVILHRSWNPGVIWTAKESDPPWLHSIIRFYNWLTRKPIALAWRGTYLAFVNCALGLAYMHYGELLRVPFQTEPDLAAAGDIYSLALYIWPIAFLALTNIYAVKRHFLPPEIHVDELVRPADVIDLNHTNDVKTRTVDAAAQEEKGISILEIAAAGVAWLVKFVKVRTAFLRHRTAEIGQTDVHSRWWSQQTLRGYRWGNDHRFSESNGWSVATHAAVIFGPMLLVFISSFFGCIDPYRIPFGGGEGPKGAKQKKKKIKVVKKKKKYLVNPYSSIIFAEISPDMIDLELETETEHAWTGRKGSAAGKGGGRGTAPGFGFGGGVPGGAVRFIRIQHNGSDWDRNMNLNGDFQMLREFFARTSIPIARKTESVTIDMLQRFPKNFSPPFIYVTGRKYFGVSSREARILREYLLKRGGFILGDSPGESFSRSFRTMMSRVLGPQAKWIDIPDDDEIYTCYYVLPRGAPPLWHHDGTRGMGIKVGGRWVCFYHPGDLGDAWKIGHSGAKKEAVERAYWMGCNIIHYSFTHYIDFHRGKF